MTTQPRRGRTGALGRGQPRSGARAVAGGVPALLRVPATGPSGTSGCRRSRRRQGGQANETLLVDLGPAHPGMVVRLPPLEATVPGLRPRPAGARPERGRRGGCAGAGAGARRERSRVDRLTVLGHAARGGRHPGTGTLLRSLRTRCRARTPAHHGGRAHRRRGGRARRRLGGPRLGRRVAGTAAAPRRSSAG